MPAPGLLILREGDPGEPEVTPSPVRDHYQHRAEVEAIVQEGTAAEFDAALDTLLTAIGTDIAADRTLGGILRLGRGERPVAIDLPLDRLQAFRALAADWSEYFGHHPTDGTGDVFFHLDLLWADPNIDFVGIDNHMPLSDWRPGSDHADTAMAPTVHDAASLAADSWTGTDVPLAEEAEANEVDILDGSTVRRTLATSTIGVTYTSDQQIADRGTLLGPSDILAVRIHQLSAAVGRGAPNTVTLHF